MGGHEPDAELPGDGVDLFQQLGKGDAPGVGVDILAQEGDILVALPHQALHLPENVLRPAAPFPAPDIGDDAVGAEVVAAIHHRHPSLGPAGAPGGQPLHDGIRLLPLCLDAPLPLAEGLVDALRQAGPSVGPGHDIHMGVASFEPVRHALLLGHAAHQGDEQPRLLALVLLEGAHGAKDPFFGVFPHGTGVVDDEIRFLQGVGEAVAHLGQHPPELLPVGGVLLAAEAVDQGQGRGFMGPGQVLPHQPGVLALGGQPGVIQDVVLCFLQIVSSGKIEFLLNTGTLYHFWGVVSTKRNGGPPGLPAQAISDQNVPQPVGSLCGVIRRRQDHVVLYIIIP